MKRIIYILFAFTFVLSSCENDPDIEHFPNPDIAFVYEVDGDYEHDYFVGSDIQFINTSVLEGSVSWDFGDGTTSNEPNPIHKYASPGVYKVKMVLENKGELIKDLMITEIFPRVFYTSSDAVTEILKTKMKLDLYLPNPENYDVRYEWIFPEGTLDANKQPVTESSEKDPGELTFSNVGSQQITLKTTFYKEGTDFEKKLEEVVVNVQVGYTKEAKTLYYAVKGGNIMALKVIKDLQSNVKNLPFDLGVKSGQHPFNILFHDSLLYVIDAGKVFYFQNDDTFRNMGDGKVSIVAQDGSTVETMFTNDGGYANDDPFCGYIDPASNTLYCSDRNTGISKVPLTERNSTGKRTGSDGSDEGANYPFWVRNARLGYYSKGILYGSLNRGFTRYNNMWWWAKTNNDGGIFRFVDTDILTKDYDAKNPSPVPSSGAILPGQKVKSFVIDETRKVLYVATAASLTEGEVYRIPIDKLTANMNPAEYQILKLLPDSEGPVGEIPYITQMVVDESDGSLYFGYRSGAGEEEKTGLKRYDYETKQLETLVVGQAIYGIAINNEKSKLF
ncbi:PKD domain-containing protein [Dysgonomonas sp. 520]|uniref:PKD domain-containing protein n=1 Tax=Dysgonomonas sp. 520 TaxID=2302931 RepID=UPI0013D3A4D4|nr:PKD domain-containing protein [Dysgonomonas sp. 520]NDW10356.1 PKD domain-containing protein [Dysgonomonas sp. 520]